MALRDVYSADQDSSESGEDADTILRFFQTPSPEENTFSFSSSNDTSTEEVHPQLAIHEEVEHSEAKDYSIYVRNEDHHIALRNAEALRWQMEFGRKEVQHDLQLQVHVKFETTSTHITRNEIKISPAPPHSQRLQPQQQPVVNVPEPEDSGLLELCRASLLSGYNELAPYSDPVFSQERQLAHTHRVDELHEPHPSTDREELSAQSRLSNAAQVAFPDQRLACCRGEHSHQVQTRITRSRSRTSRVEDHRPLQTYNRYPAALEHRLVQYGTPYQANSNQQLDATSHSSMLPACRILDDPDANDQTSQNRMPLGIDRSVGFDHQLQAAASGHGGHMATHSGADTKSTRQQFQDAIRILGGQSVDGPPGSHTPLNNEHRFQSTVGQASILVENSSQISVSQSYVGVSQLLQGFPTQAVPLAVGHDMEAVPHIAEEMPLQLQFHGMTKTATDPERSFPPLSDYTGQSSTLSTGQYPLYETAATHNVKATNAGAKVSPDLRVQSIEEIQPRNSQPNQKAGHGRRKHRSHRPKAQGRPTLPNFHCDRDQDMHHTFEEQQQQQQQLRQDLSMRLPEDHSQDPGLYPAQSHQVQNFYTPAPLSSAHLERIAEVSVAQFELARRLYERRDASGPYDQQQQQQLLATFHQPEATGESRAAHPLSSDNSFTSYDMPPSMHLKTKARFLESLSAAAYQEAYPSSSSSHQQIPGVCCQQFLDDFQFGPQADLELGFHIPVPTQPCTASHYQNGAGNVVESFHPYPESANPSLAIDIFQGIPLHHQGSGRQPEGSSRQEMIVFGNQDAGAYCSASQFTSQEEMQLGQGQGQHGAENLHLSRSRIDHAGLERSVSARNGNQQKSGQLARAASTESFPRYIKLTEVEMVQALRQYKSVHQEISIPPVVIKEADVYRVHPTSLVSEKATHYFFMDTRYSSLKKPTRLRITATRCRWKQQGRMFPIRENGQVVAFKTYLSYVRLKGSNKRTTTTTTNSTNSTNNNASGNPNSNAREGGGGGASHGRASKEAAAESRRVAAADERKWSTWTMEEIALVEEITAEKTLLKRGKRPRAFSVICRLVHKRAMAGGKKPSSVAGRGSGAAPALLGSSRTCPRGEAMEGVTKSSRKWK